MKPKNSELYNRLAKQIAKGAGITFSGQIIGRLSSFLFHILMARILGPVSYGLYVLGSSVIGIAQPVSLMGFQHSIIRFGPNYLERQDYSKYKGLVWESLLISLSTSIIISTVIFFSGDLIAIHLFNKPGLTIVIRLFSLIIPFNAMLDIICAIAQSKRKMEYRVFLQNILFFWGNIFFVSIVFFLGFRLQGAVLGTVFSTFAVVIVGATILKKRLLPQIFVSLKKTHNLKQHFKYAFPMLFVGLSYLLAIKLDKIMLGIFASASDVGTYNAAFNVAYLMLFLHSALSAIFKPIISSIDSDSGSGLRRDLFHLVTRWSSYATLFFCLIIIGQAKIFMFLFGKDFSGVEPVLIVLSCGFLASSFFGPAGPFLQMSGKQNLESINCLFFLLLNFLLNCLLIPRYGSMGAAIATLSAVIVINLIQVIEIEKIFKFHPFRKKHLLFNMVAVPMVTGSVLISMVSNNLHRCLLTMGIVGVMIIFVLCHSEAEDRHIFTAVIQKLFSRGMNDM